LTIGRLSIFVDVGNSFGISAFYPTQFTSAQVKYQK